MLFASGTYVGIRGYFLPCDWIHLQLFFLVNIGHSILCWVIFFWDPFTNVRVQKQNKKKSKINIKKQKQNQQKKHEIFQIQKKMTKIKRLENPKIQKN